MTLAQFVLESNHIEGISKRDPARLSADIKAHEDFLSLDNITVADLEKFVTVIQPDAVLRRIVGLNVRVGDHIAPGGGPLIEEELDRLVWGVSTGSPSPHDAHVRYETLHPFTDGNGRSGRALWLWMMGGIEKAPLGFLHHFYYQTLGASR